MNINEILASKKINKIAKTIYFEDNIIKKLEFYSNKNKISISDTVNKLIEVVFNIYESDTNDKTEQKDNLIQNEVIESKEEQKDNLIQNEVIENKEEQKDNLIQNEVIENKEEQNISQKEKMILEMLKNKSTYKEIKSELNVSDKTIKKIKDKYYIK